MTIVRPADLPAVIGLVLLPALAPDALAQARTRTPPNVLWISNEDMSPRLGAYGDRLARTPNLDRLAREGVRFTRAFTTSGVCAPSRSAIITGMHQNAIGTQHMRTTEDRAPELPGPYLAVPPHYVKAFTEYLRAAGYYTTNNSKTDYQFGEPLTAWDESGNEAHWRGRPDRGQPFFAVFNLTVTHESHVWADHPANRGRALVTDPDAVEVPPYYPATRAVREDLARHYDNIAEMDRQAGEILRQLEEDGLADDTVVFYWSDHGDGLPRAKRWLYDSGLHVPLIVRWPGRLSPGSVNDELVSLVDLAPTVLALAGVEPPAHLQGRVFLGPGAEPAPACVFAARDRIDVSYDMVRAARDERFKYLRNFNPEQPYVVFVPYRNRNATMQELLRLHAAGRLQGAPALWLRDRRPAEELYDTRADPHEIRNLAADPAYRAQLVRMRSELAAWMRRIDDQGLVPEAQMIRRMWPGGAQPVTAKPYILPRRATDLTADAAPALTGPMEVVIYSPTQGASVAYATGEGPDPRWKLYSGPLRVDSAVVIRAKAIRYGYKESEEARASFTLAPSAGEAR